jgi:hypothetical protein
MYFYGLGNFHTWLFWCKLFLKNCSLGDCGFYCLCQGTPTSYSLESNEASSFINLKYVMCFNSTNTTNTPTITTTAPLFFYNYHHHHYRCRHKAWFLINFGTDIRNTKVPHLVYGLFWVEPSNAISSGMANIFRDRNYGSPLTDM